MLMMILLSCSVIVRQLFTASRAILCVAHSLPSLGFRQYHETFSVVALRRLISDIYQKFGSSSEISYR